MTTDNPIVVQTFTIEGSLSGMNEMLTAAKTRLKRTKRRFQGSKYQLLKRSAGRAVSVAISQHRVIPLEWARVSIMWYEANRKRDPDNISAGIKAILDSLVTSGVLENDGWRNIKPPLIHQWEVDTLHPRIEVTLEGPERKE